MRAVDEAAAGINGGLSLVLSGLLRTDWHECDDGFGTRVFECFGGIDIFLFRNRYDLGGVLGDAVERQAFLMVSPVLGA